MALFHGSVPGWGKPHDDFTECDYFAHGIQLKIKIVFRVMIADI